MFIIGERVKLVTPNSPGTDGKKALVLGVHIDPIPTRNTVKVAAEIEPGIFKQYIVTPNQLAKVKIEPAYEAFKNALLDVAKNNELSIDAQQEQVANQANEHKKIHNIGFNEGYDQGYQDALSYVKQLMKNGLPNND